MRKIHWIWTQNYSITVVKLWTRVYYKQWQWVGVIYTRRGLHSNERASAKTGLLFVYSVCMHASRCVSQYWLEVVEMNYKITSFFIFYHGAFSQNMLQLQMVITEGMTIMKLSLQKQLMSSVEQTPALVD
jgi:hypothetical protein